MDEPNDIQATGRCSCAGCIGMGPCDLDPPRALGGLDDICRCGPICECGWDEYDEEYDSSPWLFDRIARPVDIRCVDRAEG